MQYGIGIMIKKSEKKKMKWEKPLLMMGFFISTRIRSIIYTTG